jgi:hypothetical protein
LYKKEKEKEADIQNSDNIFATQVVR